MKDISIENIADNIKQGKASFLVVAGISYLMALSLQTMRE